MIRQHAIENGNEKVLISAYFIRSTYVENEEDATLDDVLEKEDDLDYIAKGMRILSMVWRRMMIALMWMMI